MSKADPQNAWFRDEIPYAYLPSNTLILDVSGTVVHLTFFFV
jgi:hypothetical protein